MKDRKAKNFISQEEKTIYVKTLITYLIPFFVSDLKYQMIVLPMKLHQFYSWSQDRRSMEYSVENQITNRIIAMGEEKNSSFNNYLSWTQTFVEVHKFFFGGKTFQLNFGQCILLLAMWHMTSVIYMCTRPDKWHVKYNVL